MIDRKRELEAEKNFRQYLVDGLLKKESDKLCMEKYHENALLSLSVAKELMQSQLKPYLWVVVTSYYSMFYIANSVLVRLGYKTQDKIVHKVTSDAVIVLVRDRLKAGLLEHYENASRDALDITGLKVDSLIESYSFELGKRSRFQYNMLEETKEAIARTSLKRASEFVFEVSKLLNPN